MVFVIVYHQISSTPKNSFTYLEKSSDNKKLTVKYIVNLKC